MTKNENWLFGRHLETVQIFLYFFFCWNMVVISVYIYIYCAERILVFLRGFNGTPLCTKCTNRSAGYLMQLSVNIFCKFALLLMLY